ncbi:YgiT-type zinc finger domain-containing protein [Lentibacillus populi]|uniref:YgiT-type zinc finger domain-containing protein n=1 Tax=Lentibacillus populi TaxID=1827502 RepID=A0A9W5TYV4_9BACI|nr:type II toxin-antitoxin system MqsA family antitoxin [Lentibacillus populi]GGB46899.1 YgiT-type zinc finger domain-containing protein [Lentibacillus populi]
MNTCRICQGSIEKKQITVEREWKGRKIIIEDVPALVCEQCGESYFDSETTLRMEKIKKAAIYPEEKQVTIPASIRKFNQITHF